jgi:PilZ domain-containing protein
MEGPNLRRLPRTMLSGSVELRVGDRTIGLDHAVGNVSLTGMFLQDEKLPVNAPVHIKIAALSPVELDGVIRYSHSEGAGIEFTSTTSPVRQGLYDLIAQLTPREILAS